MKIAIVTGGSNGIGKATALELGKRGVSVILTYHSDKQGAENVIREIEQNKEVRALGLKLDLGNKSTFEGLRMRWPPCPKEASSTVI